MIYFYCKKDSITQSGIKINKELLIFSWFEELSNYLINVNKKIRLIKSRNKKINKLI